MHNGVRKRCLFAKFAHINKREINLLSFLKIFPIKSWTFLWSQDIHNTKAKPEFFPKLFSLLALPEHLRITSGYGISKLFFSRKKAKLGDLAWARSAQALGREAP
eukprot:Pompholyxophrys_sp_v1_NODE_105_length_1967_cov_3.812762.p4 type:complete len:105 gc:universal NODE_105_length_1967_cov_3.812762:356-42(-)